MDFCLDTHDLIDLVVAPPMDPFSDYEPKRTGEAVLPRAIRRWDMSGRWNFSKLLIRAPKEKLNAANLAAAEKMLRHYFENQLEEITINKSLFSRNTIRIFRNAFIFLTICMAIVGLVGTETFLPNLPSFLRRPLTEGFTVIGWVVMWRPVELLLSELGELRKSDQIYHLLLKANIEFEQEQLNRDTNLNF